MGHLPTKIACRVGHVNYFFKCPGYTRGFAQGGGMLVAGIDSHINNDDNNNNDNKNNNNNNNNNNKITVALL